MILYAFIHNIYLLPVHVYNMPDDFTSSWWHQD